MSAAMHSVALILVCLACKGHGRRVQASSFKGGVELLSPNRTSPMSQLALLHRQRRERAVARGARDLLELFARFSLDFNAANAFTHSNVGAILAAGKPSLVSSCQSLFGRRSHLCYRFRVLDMSDIEEDAVRYTAQLAIERKLSNMTKKQVQATLKSLGGNITKDLHSKLMKRLQELRRIENEEKPREWVPSKPVTVEGEVCNVVLTHVNADFDSLAGAVALAKLWSIERPQYPTHVVMPRGQNPSVARFLAFHKHLLPVRGFHTVRAEDVRAVGIVDTQSVSRLGQAAAWLDVAEHVVVFDHHDVKGHDHQRTGEINANEHYIEPVGSVTTMLVERLRDLTSRGERLKLSEAEATLFALGIRADTGALSYPGTTARDGSAYVYCMDQGLSQVAIAEFGHSRLSSTHRDLLAEAMRKVNITFFEGIKVGTVHFDTGQDFITGMAGVAEELLQLTSLDVLFLGSLHRERKSKTVTRPVLSLIGRCSARASTVNLDLIMRRWGGGGHPSAAAVSFRLNETLTDDELQVEAEQVLQLAKETVFDQIPRQVTAGDFMTKNVSACSLEDTMADAMDLMVRISKKSIPVLDDQARLVGMLKYRQVVKAAQKKKGSDLVKSWMARNIHSISKNTTLAEIERALIDGQLGIARDQGRLPVVDENLTLLGIVTRTDVKRQMYGNMLRR